MKRLLLAALTALSVSAVAQPLHVGLEAGAYFANLKYKANNGIIGNTTLDGDLKAGLRAGLSLEARLIRGLWLQTGAFYVSKGASDFLGADKFRLNYVQVPLYFVGKVGTGATGRFFIGGGPYVAVAVDGSVKENGQSADINFGSNGLRRLDAGLGLTTGYEFPGRVYLRGNAEFGLADVLNDGSSDRLRNNVGLGISLGYRLL